MMKKVAQSPDDDGGSVASDGEQSMAPSSVAVRR